VKGPVGIDGCKAGWVASCFEGEGIRTTVFSTLDTFAAACSGNVTLAIDMPMGLPDTISGFGRSAEQAVRGFLGKRRSSVFPIPARDAVYEVDPQPVGMEALKAGHQKANGRARLLSKPPSGLAFQSFNIFPKIRELDRFLIDHPHWMSSVFEVHPEVAFWRMNNHVPAQYPKKSAEGFKERQALLLRHDIGVSAMRHSPPKGAARDDVMDSLACLVAAREISAGHARSFPDKPERDRMGIPIAIWAWD
jgi:predicted RNase H-like nuclease